jgi:hypothetical protein
MQRRGKGLLWLADALSTPDAVYTIQRVQNWTTRGLPRKEFPAVAVALGESSDWVAGLAGPKRTDVDRLSPMAVAIAREFDAIEDDGRLLETYTKVITLIARARGT